MIFDWQNAYTEIKNTFKARLQSKAGFWGWHGGLLLPQNRINLPHHPPHFDLLLPPSIPLIKQSTGSPHHPNPPEVTPQHHHHHHLFTHSSNPTRSPLLLFHPPLLRPLQWPPQLLLLPLLSLQSKPISLSPLSLPHRRPTVLHPRQNRPRSVLRRRH